MENIGGGLGFAATLDIDDFNVSAEAMDRHFRQVSTNILPGRPGNDRLT